MASAKQSGNQGNIVLGPDGRMDERTEQKMGGRTARYQWGQSETELLLTVPDLEAGTRAQHVEFRLSHALRLVHIAVTRDMHDVDVFDC